MDMEFMFGQMGIIMKENLANAWSMGKVYRNFQTEIFIKGHMLMVNQMDMASIFGQTIAILKAHLKMDSEMGEDFGKSIPD